MSTKYYLPEDKTPLPPTNAEVLTTCCDYCIVACGYKVYRWPVGTPDGGMKASENAFKVDFPTGPLQAWVAPTQYNVGMHNDKPHNIIIVPDKDTKAVNIGGDSSIRGGCIAQKIYNPDKPTRDRLMSPMIRINGTLQPVSWDMALDVAADLISYTIKKHGANSYGMKQYSYQYVENTYAVSKFSKGSIDTANWTMHDTPANVTSTPGFRDAGFDNFGPSYKDWGDAEVLMICGTDPYETKTMIFNQFIRPAIDSGQKTIWLNVRETAGLAYAKSRGNALFIQVDPGTDTPVLGAIARVIMENGWEDSEWIKKWVNDKWGSSSGFGQGTRNTPWQWRTTWGKFQTKGYEDYKKWNLAQKDCDPKVAAEIATSLLSRSIRQLSGWLSQKPMAPVQRPLLVSRRVSTGPTTPVTPMQSAHWLPFVVQVVVRVRWWVASVVTSVVVPAVAVTHVTSRHRNVRVVVVRRSIVIVTSTPVVHVLPMLSVLPGFRQCAVPQD